MPNHIRWGILGAAKFAHEHMGPAIHAARYGELAAIATRDVSRAAAFTDFAPQLRVHDDYGDLLADPGIDAVYIPLPNHLHVEWSKRAIAACKPVLCEKPIAMQAAEIDELIELRDRSGLLVAEAYMIVHHPQWAHAKSLYESGAIGELRLVDSVFSYHLLDESNIRNRADAGGGGIRDIGVYNYGCTRYVSGAEPSGIREVDLVEENGVDVYAQVVAEFPGFHCSSIDSMRLAPRQAVTFHGNEGFIRLTCPFNAGVYSQAEVELHRPNGEVTVRRFPGVNQYVLQVENFNRALLQGETYPCPLEFSRGTQAMIDMIFAFHANRANQADG